MYSMYYTLVVGGSSACVSCVAWNVFSINSLLPPITGSALMVLLCKIFSVLSMYLQLCIELPVRLRYKSFYPCEFSCFLASVPHFQTDERNKSCEETSGLNLINLWNLMWFRGWITLWPAGLVLELEMSVFRIVMKKIVYKIFCH